MLISETMPDRAIKRIIHRLAAKNGAEDLNNIVENVYKVLLYIIFDISANLITFALIIIIRILLQLSNGDWEGLRWLLMIK